MFQNFLHWSQFGDNNLAGNFHHTPTTLININRFLIEINKQLIKSLLNTYNITIFYLF